MFKRWFKIGIVNQYKCNIILVFLKWFGKWFGNLNKKKSVILEIQVITDFYVPFTVELSNLFIEDLKKLSYAYKKLNKIYT